jgi:hypothetical protein
MLFAAPAHGRNWPITDIGRRLLDVRFWEDSVEKVGVSTRPNFFSAVGAVFKCRRGGPHHPPQTERSEF